MWFVSFLLSPAQNVGCPFYLNSPAELRRGGRVQTLSFSLFSALPASAAAAGPLLGSQGLSGLSGVASGNNVHVWPSSLSRG